MNLIEHTILTLDFWQDNVTYEGKSMPTGTLACAALNLSDEVIAKLSQLCMPLNLYMGSLQLGQANMAQMEAARESAFQIVELLRNVPPFSCLEYEIVRSSIDTVFTEDYLQNTMDFSKSGNLAGRFRRNTKRHSLCCASFRSWRISAFPWRSSSGSLCLLRRSSMRATGRRTDTPPASDNTFLLTLIYQQKIPDGCPLPMPPSNMPPRPSPARRNLNL